MMIKSFNKSNNFQFGYTLIEIIVVISIIGFILTAALYAFSYSRALARDTKRVADLSQIKKAIEMFRNDKGRYPDKANDSVDNEGECLGDQDNNGNDKPGISRCGQSVMLEKILKDYMGNIPADPKHNFSCTIDTDCNTNNNNFYYSYDNPHPCPGETSGQSCVFLCFNRSESGKFSCSKDNPDCEPPVLLGNGHMGQKWADYCIFIDMR